MQAGKPDAMHKYVDAPEDTKAAEYLVGPFEAYHVSMYFLSEENADSVKADHLDAVHDYEADSVGKRGYLIHF